MLLLRECARPIPGQKDVAITKVKGYLRSECRVQKSGGESRVTFFSVNFGHFIGDAAVFARVVVLVVISTTKGLKILAGLCVRVA